MSLVTRTSDGVGPDPVPKNGLEIGCEIRTVSAWPQSPYCCWPRLPRPSFRVWHRTFVCASQELHGAVSSIRRCLHRPLCSALHRIANTLRLVPAAISFGQRSGQGRDGAGTKHCRPELLRVLRAVWSDSLLSVLSVNTSRRLARHPKDLRPLSATDHLSENRPQKTFLHLSNGSCRSSSPTSPRPGYSDFSSGSPPRSRSTAMKRNSFSVFVCQQNGRQFSMCRTPRRESTWRANTAQSHP